MLDLLSGSDPLAFEDQADLMEALYQLEGDELHYAFRDRDVFDYACPSCATALYANLVDGTYRVWRVADDECDAPTPTSPVAPVASLEDAVSLPQNRELARAWEVALRGNRHEALGCLAQLTGSCSCPECGERHRLGYNDGWCPGAHQ